MEVITDDLFGIAGRLKDIDPMYQLYRDRDTGKIELWWQGRICMVIPFDELDCRTVEYVKKTRRENADEIAAEIDKTNAAVEADKQRNIEIMQARIKDYVKYEYQKSN